MDKNELIGQIDKAYRELQCINMQPTKANMVILLNTMNLLEKVYAHLKEETAEKQEVTADGD